MELTELNELLPEGSFVFRRRPVSVPGDLRIAWRLALLILVLSFSRGKKASLAKLHLVNDALRSEDGRNKLAHIITSPRTVPEWPFRVEPALGRAIDMARGEGLIMVEGGPTYRLTEKGIHAVEALLGQGEALQQERVFLESQGHKISEAFVRSIVQTLSLR